MEKFLEIATAVALNVIFHTWTVPFLSSKGWVGIIIAIILTFVFAFMFLVATGQIKDFDTKAQQT